MKKFNAIELEKMPKNVKQIKIEIGNNNGYWNACIRRKDEKSFFLYLNDGPHAPVWKIDHVFKTRNEALYYAHFLATEEYI